MTDENAITADLTIDEKLDRILAELADLKTWRGQVDAQREDRAKETRPKLDLLIAEMAATREDVKAGLQRLDRIEARLETLASDVLDVRGAQRRLGDRVDVIERNAA